MNWPHFAALLFNALLSSNVDLEKIRMLKAELLGLNNELGLQTTSLPIPAPSPLAALRVELVKFKELVDEPQASNKGYEHGMVAVDIPDKVIKSWGLRKDNHHITLLYFPEVNLFMLNRIARIVQKVLVEQKPFEIVTVGQEMFGPDKDVRVVLVQPSLDLVELRAKLFQAVEKEFPGIIDKKYPVYRPHITIGELGDGLDYVDTDGSFKIDTLVVQMMDQETYNIKFGT